MVGLCAGQAVRLNVINTAELDSPLAQIAWRMGFVINPTSEPLRQETFTLGPGQSAFLDVSRDAIPGHPENRVQLRATAQGLGAPAAAGVATLEVFDTDTGKTGVFLALSEVERSSPGRLLQFASGMVGLCAGQTVRLNVINTAELDSPLAQIAWRMGYTVNPNSEPLRQETFTLEPGQSAFLDVSRDAIPGHSDNRVQLRATAQGLGAQAAAGVATLEVFDTDTGKTRVWMRLQDASQ
jgi:hypothetical protein